MKTKHESGGSKAVGSRNSAGRSFKLGLFLVGTAALMGPAFPATAFASETNDGPAITVLVFNFRQARLKHW